MLKKIYNFCKITIKSAPIFFILNMVILMLLTVAVLGLAFSFKWATDMLVKVQETNEIGISLAFPMIFFFIVISICGNSGNLTRMLKTLYTNKSNKFFNKYFMLKSYKDKQDNFYDNKYYDTYIFNKNNIENTTLITITIFNYLFLDIFGLIIASITISFFNPIILIIILILTIVIIIVNKYIVKARLKLNQSYINDERKAEYYKELLSGKSHSKELRIFKLQDHFLALWSNSFKKYSISKYRFENKALLLSAIPAIFQQILTTIMIIYFIYMVSIGEMSVGDFTFMSRIMWMLVYRISDIIELCSNDIWECYKYIEEYEKFTGELNKNNAEELSNYKLKEFDLCEGEFEELVFENVTYSYPSQEGNAVKNINLKIKKGEVISILGYNGSGKTTLSKLMCKILQDYKGKITLNNKNIKEIPDESIYKYFGIGFQDFTSYSLTLKENIGFGMIEKIHDNDEIEQAINRGNLNDIINKLPNGLDTIIGKEYDSSGQELSGGQWQKVILSRAYMGKPEILILDEPTASIDPLEEMRILQHFKDILKDKTALLISHRIGFAQMSDRICIMKDGEIVEEGTHNELIELKKYYYELYISQQELYAPIKNLNESEVV